MTKFCFPLLLVLIVKAQTPAAPPPSSAASLEGKTLNADGKPARKCAVSLRRSADLDKQPKAYTTLSSAEGTFSFSEIEQGEYQLWAQCAGCLTMIYGASHGYTLGARLSITDGQHLKDLTFKLIPESIITGKIVDEDDDPFSPRCSVVAWKPTLREGTRGFEPAGWATTGRDGEFRIAGLAPGKYYLSSATDRTVSWASQGAGSVEAYGTTYYPSSPALELAAQVDIREGQEVNGLKIRMRRSAVRHVRGKVLSQVPDLVPSRVRASLWLAHQNADTASTFLKFQDDSGVLSQDWRFDLSATEPGAYYLLVADSRNPIRPLGRAVIQVAASDIENLTVPVFPPAKVRGVVRFDKSDEQGATKPPSVKGVMIRLRAADSLVINPPSASAGGDGTFILDDVGVGSYQIAVRQLPAGTYLKSVRMGGDEVTGRAVTINGGDLIEVIVSADAAQIGGTVEDDQNHRVPRAVVVLTPEPPRLEQGHLYQTTTTNENGEFSFQNLGPGAYSVRAWEDMDTSAGLQYDPDLTRLSQNRGAAITIGENDMRQVQLLVIPADRQ